LIDEIGEDSDGEDGLFDSVCAICDNGGELLWYDFFFLLGLFEFSMISLLCVAYLGYFT